ncbi:MAG: osmoprotectant transport system substrate-binding protein, partial [Actinomycetota bacterium]|nr:osmoprotectant transport system substrate-binding protein [Actinomycetota bacterium]
TSRARRPCIGHRLRSPAWPLARSADTTIRTKIRWLAAPLVSCVVACSAGQSAPSVAPSLATGDNAITVGSFDFPESVVLAEIYAQALEANGYKVLRQFQIGTREIVDPALEKGLIELVPEYSGSALASLGAAVPPGDDHDALVDAFAPHGVTVLAAGPAQDQNGFAVRAETAAEYGLSRLSDLSDIAASLTLGGPPECPERPLCLLGLQDTYGLRFQSFVPLDSSGPVTAEALRTAAVDVALLFTTDGSIERDGFVLLRDDKALQPDEHVTPVVNGEVIRRFGQPVVRVIDDVSAQLTTEDLRSLNAAVADGLSPAAAATAWLAAHGPG